MTFTPVSVDEMVAAVRALPDRSCAVDPFPTSTLKTVVGELAPFLTELVNRSLSTGCVPEVFKEAYITPRLKKVDHDGTQRRREDYLGHELDRCCERRNRKPIYQPKSSCCYYVY